MPVADYECPCGKITEVIRVGPLPSVTKCECGQIAKRIITMTGQHCGNMDDTTWSKITAKVLDPRSQDPIMVEARENPTKRNVIRALKHKGLRIEDPGEKHNPETLEQFRGRTNKYVSDELRKFRRIEI